MARTHLCLAVVALLAGAAMAAENAPAPKKDEQKKDAVKATASSTASGSGQAQSSCAKQCFDSAKKLGFERVAADSLACVAPFKGKQLSTYDCCDKAELLLGSRGPLANCLCCPEYAQTFLGAVPYAKLGISPKEYLEKLHLCRVPLAGQSTCPSPAKLAKESAFEAAAAPPPSAGQRLEPKPLIRQINLTGLYPLVGFDSRFDAGMLAAQGSAAVANGSIARITVSGASDLYNDYITGFVMWIEKDTPRYNTPKLPKLPPLPDQYKDDVLWVANLRRGPYPDLIKNRPKAFSPQETDPLQNGQISRLPPGPAFSGRFAQFNGPNGR